MNLRRKVEQEIAYVRNIVPSLPEVNSINVHFLMRTPPTLIIIFRNVGIMVLEQATFSHNTSPEALRRLRSILAESRPPDVDAMCSGPQLRRIEFWYSVLMSP